MRFRICALLAIFFMFFLSFSIGALAEEDAAEADDNGLPTIAAKTEGMQKHPGFLSFYWDENTGSVFVEVERWDEDLLYVHYLATGLGSNPVGLDRGQLGSEKVVRFHRVGPKVLLTHRNLRFRAITDNLLEQMAVKESFAESVIWGGKVVAETGGKALIDITSLLMSDSHDVIQTLANNDQGSFSLDEEILSKVVFLLERERWRILLKP